MRLHRLIALPLVAALLVFRDPSAATYRTEQTLDSGDIHPLAFPDLAIAVTRLL